MIQPEEESSDWKNGPEIDEVANLIRDIHKIESVNFNILLVG